VKATRRVASSRRIRQNFQVGENFSEKRSRFTQLLFRDINGDVSGRPLEGFDENPRLGARASAESNQLDIRSELRRDFGAMSIQNIELGLGDVILWQLANFLEQRCSSFIVKILARHRAWIGRKASNYI
jgi:hypothetical protein